MSANPWWIFSQGNPPTTDDIGILTPKYAKGLKEAWAYNVLRSKWYFFSKSTGHWHAMQTGNYVPKEYLAQLLLIT